MRPKAGYFNEDLGFIGQIDCTVFEDDWEDTMRSCATGILDADGDMIFAMPDRQHFLGFLDPYRHYEDE